MAFRVVRQRREARRQAKLDDIFMERDKNQTGKITLEQLEDIFRIYQVDLDEKILARVTDDNQEVSKEDFVRIALENKLLDFGNVMGGDHMKNAQKNTKKYSNYTTGQEMPSGKHSLLCCLASSSGRSEAKRRAEEEEEAGPRLDRVEQAFRRFDIDQDGFLSWSEFKQMGMEEETARRIFRYCDQRDQGKITLEDFRRATLKKNAKNYEP